MEATNRRGSARQPTMPITYLICKLIIIYHSLLLSIPPAQTVQGAMRDHLRSLLSLLLKHSMAPMRARLSRGTNAEARHGKNSNGLNHWHHWKTFSVYSTCICSLKYSSTCAMIHWTFVV